MSSYSQNMTILISPHIDLNYSAIMHILPSINISCNAAIVYVCNQVGIEQYLHVRMHANL